MTTRKGLTAKELGRALRAARESSGLTQQDVCEMLEGAGSDQSNYSKAERGKLPWLATTALKALGGDAEKQVEATYTVRLPGAVKLTPVRKGSLLNVDLSELGSPENVSDLPTCATIVEGQAGFDTFWRADLAARLQVNGDTRELLGHEELGVTRHDLKDEARDRSFRAVTVWEGSTREVLQAWTLWEFGAESETDMELLLSSLQLRPDLLAEIN